MTPDEMRVAIAKICHPEYAAYEPEYWYTQRNDYERDLVWKTTENGGLTIESVLVPDYCNDLNAMHEAAQTLDRLQRQKFYRNLQEVCAVQQKDKAPRYLQEYELIHATAAQRAEAFCRVFWPEKFN